MYSKWNSETSYPPSAPQMHTGQSSQADEPKAEKSRRSNGIADQAHGKQQSVIAAFD
nr:hypothetical protein [Bacillus licheniformis]